MQVVELNDPPVVPAFRVKVIVPDGVLEPGVRDVTAARHEDVWVVEIELGAQTTAVAVLTLGTVTTIDAEVALALGLWVVSPP